MKRFGIVAAIAIAAAAQAQVDPPPVDPYPGATMLPPGSIATIVQPPAINSRIGPGATPRGIAFPIAGQLLQGTRWRATQAAPATKSPACSRGWVQLFSLEAGQDVTSGNRDVWICRGDGSGMYATVTTADEPPAPASTQGIPTSSAEQPPPGPRPSASPVARPAAPRPAIEPIRPSTPGVVIAGATGSDSVTLNWNPSPNAAREAVAGYRIERCAGANCSDFREIATAQRPPYVDARLAPQTTYAYRIRAFDIGGNQGDYTAAAQATTLPPVQSLPDLAITEFKAPQAGVIGAQIEVSATTMNKGATAAAAYRVAFYFTDNTTTTFSGTYCDMPALPPGASGPCRGTVAIPGSLVAGSYWIVAYADDLNVVVEKDESNNTGGVVIALSAPPAVASPTLPVPTGLTANVASGGSIRLAWSAPPRGSAQPPAGYKVERCLGTGCTAFIQVGTSTSTSHIDTGLVAGTAYVYRVRAFDSAGNSSNYSNTASALVRPMASASGPDRSNSQ